MDEQINNNLITPPPPVEPPKTNWFFKHEVLYSVIGVLLLVVIVGSVYWWKEIKKTNEAGQIQLTQTNIPADWKTYSDQMYGFEFKYPPIWTIGNVKGFSYVAKVNNPDKPKFNYVLDITVFDNKDISNSNISTYFGEVAGHKAYEYCLIGCDKEDKNKTRLNGAALVIQNVPNENSSTIINYNAVTVPHSEEELKNIELIISTLKLVNLSNALGQKLYKNTDFGFQFSYPTSYSITSDISNSNGLRVILEKNDNRGELIFDATPKDKALDHSGNSVKPDVTNPLITSKYVGTNDPSASIGRTDYYASNSKFVYRIGITNKFEGYTDLDLYIKEAKDIIETFKFTEQSESFRYLPVGERLEWTEDTKWNFDQPTTFVTYSNVSKGFSFQIPYNENWGISEIKLKPYEEKDGAVYFDNVTVGCEGGCSMERDARVYTENYQSAEAMMADLNKKRSDCEFCFGVKPTIVKFGSLQAVEYEYGELGSQKFVIVIGKEFNYVFTGYNIEVKDLEPIAKTIKLN